MTVSQAADALGLARKTVLERCRNGLIPAIPKAYGNKTTFLIHSHDLEELKKKSTELKEAEQRCKNTQQHKDFIPSWIHAMEKGLFNGKVFSSATVKDYQYYTDLYFGKYKIVTIEALKAELGKIPVTQFSKREHYYKAVLCFGKYLIQQKALDESFLQESKPIRPKRHLPLKRLTVSEGDIKALLASCESAQERLIIVLLAGTGLRASEACSLKWSDIDLQNGFLTVQCGKGGKSRKVGLSNPVLQALELLRTQRHPIKINSPILLDNLGKQMHRHGLYQRVERVGTLANVSVNPHALRRSFVTINANKGRPLQMLQRACGHSDIKTTMSYCRTSEQEVIDAMKGW